MRLSQPWALDRFHFLFLSEVYPKTTWQSCRPASSTPWLRFYSCTYFLWLRRHFLFPASLGLISFLFFLILAQRDAARESFWPMDEPGQFCCIWQCNFLVWRVEIKVLVVVGNEAWNWANPEYLIDFIFRCVQISHFKWPDRPAGRHLRFAGFADIFVRTFAGCGDIICFLLPPTWCFLLLLLLLLLLRSPWPSKMELDRVSALWMNLASFVAFDNATL